jgi:high-affinity Fe2+/Pb2+ permease
MIRIYMWSAALAVVVGGVLLWGWWYQHRHDWSTGKHDESMRRHVNNNYD